MLEGGLDANCASAENPTEDTRASSTRRTTGDEHRSHDSGNQFIDAFIPSGGGGLVVPLSPVFHEGSLYVGDLGTHGIHRFDAKTGRFLGMFVPAGSRGMTDGDPQLFTFGPDDDLYVAAPSLNRVLRYNGRTGNFTDEFVKPTTENLVVYSGLTFGPDGNLYVGTPNGVNRYQGRTGKFIDYFVPQGSGGLQGPVELLFGPDRNLYVASAMSGDVLRYDGKSGAFVDAFIPAGRGGIGGPRQMLFKLTIRLCHQGKPISVGQLAAGELVRQGDTVGRCLHNDDHNEEDDR